MEINHARTHIFLLSIVAIVLSVAHPAFADSSEHGKSSQRGQGHHGGQPKFKNPPQESSHSGALNTELTARKREQIVAGRQVETRVYNGKFTPPTLRVKPGDTLNLRLVNQLEDPVTERTNLHTHGWNVSPLPGSDDIFMQIGPGEYFDYSIYVPENHPEGLFWYHPHAHKPQLDPDAPTIGNTEFQIFSGMSGGLIVDGILNPFPQLEGIEERILLLKDIQITDDGKIPFPIDSNAGTTRMVNGVSNPVMSIHPGELQFWRVGNVGTDIYYNIQLDGHTLYQVARDGNRTRKLIRRKEILLPPSSRAEFFVRGGKPGIYTLRTLAMTTGPAGDQYPEATLATLQVKGHKAVHVPLPKNRQFPSVEDFRDALPLPPGKRRDFVFSESDDGNTFFINGKEFNINRVDFTVPVGHIEEWTIKNTSSEWHVFHIHQTDFQVIEINGEKQKFVGHQDTINIPYQVDGQPGTVKVLIDFRDPVILGKFVAHCHIGAHEDNGMMSVVEVVEDD